MDIMGYKSFWSESEGSVPEFRINTASHIWNAMLGEHFFEDCRHKNTICRKIKRIEEVSELEVKDSVFAVKPVGDVYGHMMVKDATLTEEVETDGFFPIMPNYVRDLAGRVICIAECYPLQKEAGLSKRFPIPSFIVDETIDKNSLIENVFFSTFRTLDFSPYESVYRKGGVDHKYYSYPAANLHPYKLRVDSFYQDGWRLPQTEMLYAVKNPDTKQVDEALSDLMNKWKDYEDKANYEGFYEQVGGERYFEDLFKKGVTLIPTLEAYNANPVVDRNFNLIDFSYGKVVPEFHEIEKYVDSDLPSGTIVSVVEPGCITYFETFKAKVIVSNGSQYVSDNDRDPSPLFPDLRLPHQRTSSKWGDTYLPTHPKHFETSAIWGWDSKTGMFMQEKGPIWDPLHYYYESTDKIIDAYQGEVMDENYWMIKVPEEMKARFYPIVPFEGFDIIDADEKQERKEYRVRPDTLCKRYTESVFSANIGYHSMPAEFEYEIDSWVMPMLSPVHRVIADVPLNIRNKIAEPILCNVPAKLYANKQMENSQNNTYWMNEVTKLMDSSGEYKHDYPYLLRYLDNLTTHSRVQALINLYLYIDDIDLEMLRTEYMATLEMPKNIENYIRDINLAYFDFKEKSFLRLKDRVDLFTGYYDEYVMSSWNSAKAEDMSYMLKDSNVTKIEKGQFSSVAIMQPPTF